MDQNQGDEEVLDFEDEAVDGTRGGEGGEEDATTGLALSVGTGHLDENGSSEEPVGGRNEEDEAQGEEGQQRVSGGRDHESQDMHVDELSDCGISNPHAELAEAWGMEGMEDEEGGNEMEDAEGLLRRPPHGSEVFVGNISRDVDGETLKRMFSKCGEVVSVSVPPDPSRSSQNKGYAFVTYASKQQADAAVSEFMGAALPDFPDRKIRVAASHSRNRLYCAGIPRGMPKSELVRALKQNTVGVTDVNLVMAKENVGENRGYCFITYYNQACAEKALQALSSPAFSLGSRHLQLEWAEKRRDEAAEPPPSSKVIWVGGLPADGSEDDLRRIFAEYGDIERVAVPAPRGDGRARRFGFVHFADRATAQRAVDDAARQPFELAGTQLEVAIAKAGEGGPRAERASRPEDDARGGGGGGTRGGGGAGAAALGCLRQGFAGQLPHASVNLRTARGGPSSTWREAPQSAPRGGERLREEWRPTSAGYSHARSSWEEEEEEDAGNAFEPRGATRSHAASGSSLIPALMGSIPTLLPLSTPPASYLPEAMLNAAESAGGRGRGRGREDAAPAARRRLPPGPAPLSSNRLPPGGRGPASGPGYGGGGSRVFDDRDAADNTHPPSSRHRDDVPLPPTLPKPAHLPPPPQDWDAEDVRRAPSSEPPPRRRNGLPRPRPRDSSAFSDAPMRSPRMQLQHDGGGDSEDEEYPRYGRGGPRYRPY